MAGGKAITQRDVWAYHSAHTDCLMLRASRFEPGYVYTMKWARNSLPHLCFRAQREIKSHSEYQLDFLSLMLQNGHIAWYSVKLDLHLGQYQAMKSSLTLVSGI